VAHFLSKLPFGGLSPLQLLWLQYSQLGDALRSHNYATVHWELEHMTETLEEFLYGHKTKSVGDASEDESLD